MAAAQGAQQRVLLSGPASGDTIWALAMPTERAEQVRGTAGLCTVLRQAFQVHGVPAARREGHGKLGALSGRGEALEANTATLFGGGGRSDRGSFPGWGLVCRGRADGKRRPRCTHGTVRGSRAGGMRHGVKLGDGVRAQNQPFHTDERGHVCESGQENQGLGGLSRHRDQELRTCRRSGLKLKGRCRELPLWLALRRRGSRGPKGELSKIRFAWKWTQDAPCAS